MRILITSGLTSSDIGGPFQYASKLKSEFETLNHEVRIASYGNVERALPIGIRHLFFLIKITGNFIWADYVLALDTYSTGVPTAILNSLFRRKVLARIGGDFLWSAYVNRTSAPITLSDFYKQPIKLNFKEEVIQFFTRFFIENVDHLAFNTEWQKKIWRDAYKVRDSKLSVVRNFIPEKNPISHGGVKNFIWAGRAIPEKNLELLKNVADKIRGKYSDFRLDIITNKSHSEVLDLLKCSYAAVSSAYTDICPNFILEAASFGKPFIMTQETGLNEIYPNGGIFVDPISEVEWENAVEQLLNEQVYNRFTQYLKEVNISHTWRDIAQEYLNIWQKI